MQKITEEEWGTKLEQMETRFERKREIGLILQTFVHVGSEKLTQLQNQTSQLERQKLAAVIVKEMEEVREYVNKSLLAKGMQMGMVVPQFDKYFIYGWASREQIQSEKNKRGGPVKEEDDEGEIEGPVEEPMATNVIVQPPPVDTNTNVMVEIDGEIIEMTREQALAILQVQ